MAVRVRRGGSHRGPTHRATARSSGPVTFAARDERRRSCSIYERFEDLGRRQRLAGGGDDAVLRRDGRPVGGELRLDRGHPQPRLESGEVERATALRQIAEVEAGIRESIDSPATPPDRAPSTSSISRASRSIRSARIKVMANSSTATRSPCSSTSMPTMSRREAPNAARRRPTPGPIRSHTRTRNRVSASLRARLENSAVSHERSVRCDHCRGYGAVCGGPVAATLPGV